MWDTKTAHVELKVNDCKPLPFTCLLFSLNQHLRTRSFIQPKGRISMMISSDVSDSEMYFVYIGLIHLALLLSY